MLIRLRRFLGYAIGLGLLALCVPSPLVAQSHTRPYPVSLQVLAPSSGGNRIPTVTLSGWPIVLKMSAIKEIGIGTQREGNRVDNRRPSDFPVSGDQGFLVFEEPDDCHSWLLETDPWTGEPICTVNETYLAFNSGSCSGGQLPGGVPSLMLLADSSGGTNLADQFTVVGYELDDTNHQTNVVASLVVPSWFLRSPPAVDQCVGALRFPEIGPCEGEVLGLDSSGEVVDLVQLTAAFNQSNITTLRAFVVSGIAPQFLNDADGDDVTGSKDAELAGFRVISREAVFRVRTLYQFWDLFQSPVLFDLDANGLATCQLCLCADCAPGGGALTPVPR